MSKFETEQDREARYTWNEEDEVELVERGEGKSFSLTDEVQPVEVEPEK